LFLFLANLIPKINNGSNRKLMELKNLLAILLFNANLLNRLRGSLKKKNADYGRKLYLSEKCIYGVDIQQIAVEIAKLRFFISLLVDEKIEFDDPENNYGIEPLPNLEFKLMQGNSLISTYAGIDFNDNKNEEIGTSLKEKHTQIKEIKSKQKEVESEFLKILNGENRHDKKLKKELDVIDKAKRRLESELKKIENSKESSGSDEHKKLIKEFEELKNQYQNEADNKIKKELRDKIDKAIIKIFEEKISAHFPELKRIEENAKLLPKEEQRKKYITEEKQKLTKKLGFDIEQVEKDLITYTEGRKAKGFFLWNIYFAEVFSQKGGFDVVIGNPPYVSAPSMVKRDSKMRDAIINTKRYTTLYQKWDLYIPFMELGL